MPLGKKGSRSGNSGKSLVRFAHNWNDGIMGLVDWDNGLLLKPSEAPP